MSANSLLAKLTALGLRILLSTKPCRKNKIGEMVFFIVMKKVFKNLLIIFELAVLITLAYFAIGLIIYAFF